MKNTLLRLKNMYWVSLFLAALLFSCNDCKHQPNSVKKEDKELMLQTEHCRYYCLYRNGFNNKCEIAVSECDSGYSGDVSVDVP